ncbi:MAG: hypothetical protein WCL00_03100, partial [Bacteroidota bacterium]
MKVLSIFIGVLLLSLQSYGLTIKIRVEEDGKISFFKENHKIKYDSLELELKKNERIIFEIENPQNKNISVKFLNFQNKRLILDSITLSHITSFPTDEKLILKINKFTMDLQKSFQLFAGLADGSSPANAVTFNVYIANEQALDNPVKGRSSIQYETATINIPERVYNPGSMVYDALKLADVDQISDNELKKIIKFYFPQENINDRKKAITVASGNPFLKQFINDQYFPRKADSPSAQGGGELLSSLSLSSIGGPEGPWQVATSVPDEIQK